MKSEQDKSALQSLKLLYLSLFAAFLLFLFLGWFSWTLQQELHRLGRENTRGHVSGPPASDNYGSMYPFLILLAGTSMFFFICMGIYRLHGRYGDNSCSSEESAQKQNRFHAYYDSLTGLPNRTLFADRLERALAYARRKQRKLALLLLDLDNFKTVNESLGHRTGDQYLCNVSERLKKTCRDEDTVARMGGDEFIIILPDVKDIGDALIVARRIRENFADPVLLGEYELFISTSIGITVYPDDGEDAGTLVKNADIAVYKAKEQGKDTYAVFTPEMNNAASRRIYMESSLRRALKNNEFRLFYQPKVNLLSHMITGTEALIRWEKHPGLIIPPKDFIPLVEETGLILPLGRWVLHNACLQTRIWNDMFDYRLTVAVNLSARQFQQEDLPGMIRSVLKESRMEPHLLNIEITENIVMDNVEKAIETMKEISEMGIRISIDDFGTGYSSLNYLKRFPLDVLKIDRTFVKDIPDHPEDMAIAKTILSLAKNLNLQVVAEGVENIAQLEFFGLHGCQEIQGYLFSKPLSVPELTELLKQGRVLSV